MNAHPHIKYYLPIIHELKSFSDNLWSNKLIAIVTISSVNLFYIVSWYRGLGIFAIISFLFLYYLLLTILLRYFFFTVKMNDEEAAKQAKSIYEKGNPIFNLKKYVNKVTSLEDPLYTIKRITVVYIVYRVNRLLGDKLIIWILINLLLFNGLFEKRQPHFLTLLILSIKQIVEGIFGLLDCIIPKYTGKEK